MIKRRYIPVMLMLGVITAMACQMPAPPQKYFAATVLNANAVSHFGSDYFITALGYSKRPLAAGVDQYTYEQQVGFAIQRVERYLKSVNGLMPTQDSKAMLDASRDLFRFTLESYSTDHLQIAKMIDRKAPQEEVAQAMQALDGKSYETFLAKYEKLRNIGIQYARDHDIPLMKMSKFNR
jgi:hypothetical protein